MNGQACAQTLDLYERGRGCRAASAVRAVLVCEVGGPSLYRRSRCGAGGLIGAAAAHSSPGQAERRCRSRVGARGKRLRAVGPCCLARSSRSRCSGRLGFEFVEDVVGAAADLAGDGEHRPLAADARRGLRVQDAVGTIGALGVLGRFDQRPTERGCAVLGEVTAASSVARLVDDRIEAGGADRLSCGERPGFCVCVIRKGGSCPRRRSRTS